MHDPGHVSPDPELGFSFPAYARLSETGRLPIRVHASIRDDALATALAGGLRSGDILGADPDGRARIGWQKCYADGSLGSRTAALLADIEPEPDHPLPPERRRGIWMTEPEALRDLVDRAAAGGIATQIHAIGDAAVRAALDALEPTAGRSAVHAPDRAPPAASTRRTGPGSPPRASRPASSPSISGRTRPRRDGCGVTGPSGTATPGARSPRPGRSSPSGPTPRSSRSTRGPGIALAVRREDPSWPAGTPAFGPDEALSIERALRAACVDPAVTAGERDRGRLTVGQRADVAIIPSAAIDDPAGPDGALASVRPSIVLVDGRVVHEL